MLNPLFSILIDVVRRRVSAEWIRIEVSAKITRVEVSVRILNYYRARVSLFPSGVNPTPHHVKNGYVDDAMCDLL